MCPTPTEASARRTDSDLVVTRDLDAPRPLVWQAWTDPQHVAAWFGPEGFRTRVEALELRPGGRARYVMIAPDGAEYPSTGVFSEVVPLERTVVTDEFDEGFQPEGVDLPTGMVQTTTFEDTAAGGTRVTVRITHPSVEERRKHEEMGVIEGWQSTLDCLAAHLRTIAAGM